MREKMFLIKIKQRAQNPSDLTGAPKGFYEYYL